MAEYSTTYIYWLDPANGGGFNFADSWGEDNTFTDGTSDDTFDLEERLTGTNGYDLTFYGVTDGGWIGYESQTNTYFLFADNGGIREPVTVRREALAVCFMPGTAIACPDGARAVETLAIGDAVLTAGGETRPVRWIGRQTVMPVFADALRSHPVRIQAGALGDGLPVRDLCVSPDHALLVDGLLVHAGALVNGTTIIRMTDLPDRFTYYHVELEDHSLILAEGVSAETFVDNVSRRRFDNHAEFAALYGEGTAIGEMDLPRIKSARQLPDRIRRRLAGAVAA